MRRLYQIYGSFQVLIRWNMNIFAALLCNLAGLSAQVKSTHSKQLTSYQIMPRTTLFSNSVTEGRFTAHRFSVFRDDDTGNYYLWHVGSLFRLPESEREQDVQQIRRRIFFVLFLSELLVPVGNRHGGLENVGSRLEIFISISNEHTRSMMCL